MCRRVICEECGKPGFKGCGKHVEQVLGDVPRPDRCRCHEKPAGHTSVPETKPSSWLDRLRGAKR